MLEASLMENKKSYGKKKQALTGFSRSLAFFPPTVFFCVVSRLPWLLPSLSLHNLHHQDRAHKNNGKN